ncbi:MAG: hypothetical protein E6J41_05700 [Chloroflexi bacterium]|nr:MAG: hypothetical protein E6J41_05700 [Chloroflexota bacterium]
MGVHVGRRAEVHAGRTPEAAVAAAARWTGGSPTWVRSSANHVFRLSRPDREWYLRLAPTSERRREAIEAELDFVLHCAAAGVAVAPPVPSARGALVEEVLSGSAGCYAVVFEALRGRQVEWDALDEPMALAWGRALARLHEASETFSAAARPVWADEARTALASVPADEGGIVAELESGLAWLGTAPAGESGLLHGDFELDNLVWDGARCQACDFDSCGYGPYALDIAIALQDVCEGRGATRDRCLDWFFAGYGEVRPVPAGTRALLPRLVRLLSVVKVAGLLAAYAGVDRGDAPDWLTAMRARHERWLGVRRAALGIA